MDWTFVNKRIAIVKLWTEFAGRKVNRLETIFYSNAALNIVEWKTSNRNHRTNQHYKNRRFHCAWLHLEITHQEQKKNTFEVKLGDGRDPCPETLLAKRKSKNCLLYTYCMVTIPTHTRIRLKVSINMSYATLLGWFSIRLLFRLVWHNAR